MVKFLIHRPIAVCITFLAFLFVGIVAFKSLPVSMLPDVPIPVVTVQVENREFGVQEMEKLVTNRLRRYLMQCNSLKDIESISKDGSSTITLQFEYGTNTGIAAIDVNEKIDRAMNSLPEGTSRPRVYKASATDVPAFYLNLYYTDTVNESDMVVLSEYATNVVRRRLEQLKEVAMVDITGVVEPQIKISPIAEKVKSIGIEPYHFQTAFEQNNLEMGVVKVNEGYYNYSVRLSNKQAGIEELRLLPITVGNRIFTLGELAEINLDEGDKNGIFLTGNQTALSLAVIKQSDAKIADLKKSLDGALYHLRNENPRITIAIARDQIALLDYSINGLKQSLFLGAVLAFLIIFAFLSDIRLPLIMGLILPVSIIVSFLFFKLFNISLNIISLSGVILAVGMMIDNSIIVIDNITQFRERGEKTNIAVIDATNEVIRPLLSSALTTCAVFIPLVFLSGMAGTLFIEQAITVSIGLGVSFWVSITLLPTLYLLFFSRKKVRKRKKNYRRKELIPLTGAYKKGFDFVFRYKRLFLVVFFAAAVSIFPLYKWITKETFPVLTQDEAILKIEWNENINLEAGRGRISKLVDLYKSAGIKVDAWIGNQQYILVREFSEGLNVTHLWLKAGQKDKLDSIIKETKEYFLLNYPLAEISKLPNSNLFEKTFMNNGADFELRLSNENDNAIDLELIRQVRDSIQLHTGYQAINKIKENDFIVLHYDAVKLNLYGITPSRFINNLRTKLKNHHIGFYTAFNQQIPVVITEKAKTLDEIISFETIKDKDKRDIPLKTFLAKEKATQPYQIVAAAEGEYVPLQYVPGNKNINKLEKHISRILRTSFPEVKFGFKGQVYENNRLMKELSIILLISVMLLYFILAAQFESLTQPIIVLLEIPIDIAGTLLLLKLFGSSLNIMSAIGIIVMTGIIINDSILKIDTINRLRRLEGYSIMDAIHEGGKRRLRPIIMTSLTTILALTPVFFGHSMGIELQRPLALAIVGGLGVGTLVSLYFIPLLYWFIYQKSEKKTKYDTL